MTTWVKGCTVVKSLLSPQQATYAPEQNVIVGNTCLYGATGGSLCQRAGERFAVRNSRLLP